MGRLVVRVVAAVVTVARGMLSLAWALGMRMPLIREQLQFLWSWWKTTMGVKVSTILTGKTLGSHESFMKRLAAQLTLVEVPLDQDCDIILAFCPIVSRVGTDIEAALPEIPGGRQAILVVFHYTLDEYYTVPNTSRFTESRNIPTVDCLFNDSGLLKSPQNDEALKLTVQHLKPLQWNKMRWWLRLFSSLADRLRLPWNDNNWQD